ALGKTTANLLPELTQHGRVLHFIFGRSPAGEHPTVRPFRATGHGASSMLQDTVCLTVRAIFHGQCPKLRNGLWLHSLLSRDSLGSVEADGLARFLDKDAQQALLLGDDLDLAGHAELQLAAELAAADLGAGQL